MKCRPPRSVAITLTCPPESYAAAINKARECIKLEELNIKSLRLRRGITGSLVLEIKDPEGAKKARILKERKKGGP